MCFSSNHVLLILAGGQARRLGGKDKCLLTIGDRSILSRQLAALASPAVAICLSAAFPHERFADFDIPLIADQLAVGEGPLAGIASGFEFFRRQQLAAQQMLVVAGDMPFLPANLAETLSLSGDPDQIICPRSLGQIHPAASLWPFSLAPALKLWLEDRKERSMMRFIASQPHKIVDWPDQIPDPFFNINTPQDLIEAEKWSRAR